MRDDVVAQVAAVGHKRSEHWPQRYIRHLHFFSNSLTKAFEKCGEENPSYSPIDELSSDICIAADQILTALRDWGEAHISQCKRYINHRRHFKRINKWMGLYNEVLGC